MGQSDAVIAGGVESMSQVPMGGYRYLPNPRLQADDPDTYLNMGLTAERLAESDRISRDEQDLFALNSHRKALDAQQENRFADEIVPVVTSLTDPDADGKPVEREI